MTFDEFIADGAARFFASPPKRVRGSRLIPRLVADRLARSPDAQQMTKWSRRVIQHWHNARAEQAGATGNGWAELLAGLLLAAELLDSESLAGLGSYENEIARIYRRESLRFRRYALVVAGECRAVRVLVESTGDSGSISLDEADRRPIEEALSWTLLDANRPNSMLAGRSHTLILGIIVLHQRGLLPDLPVDSPLAATGELRAPMSRILQMNSPIAPVQSLSDKARVWFAQPSGGVLITAPPASVERDDWRSLLEFKHTGRHRSGLREPDMSKADTRRAVWQRWLTAGSLLELRAKLALRFGTAAGDVRSWDGQPLPAERIAPLTLEWTKDTAKPVDDWRTRDDDPLIDALWAATRNARRGHGARGVLVEGAPGAGKSLWARLLEGRCATGPLGALGYAVYYPARTFAASLDAGHDPLRTTDENERNALVAQLHNDGRLIAVVDGLDELQPRALARVANWLAASGLRFVATSREQASIRETLGQTLRLTIKPLDSQQAGALLIAHGREDLARHLFGNNLAPRPSNALTSFCDRPFTLSLLMRAVDRGDDPRGLDETALYRATYQTLIRQAHRHDRISSEQAALLESSPGEFLGELAIRWLRSSRGFIDDAKLSTLLAAHGFVSRDGVDIRRALEFGFLLAPVGDSWQFVHRTMAEWLAAKALEHRVLRRLHEQQLDDVDGETISPEQRRAIEDIEMAEIGWLIQEDDRWERNSWRQILRFYAPLCRAPEGLVRTLVGPGIKAMLGDVRASLTRLVGGHDVDRYLLSWLTGQWQFTVELMSHARWRDDKISARRCWAVVARALLLPAGWNPWIRHWREWKYWVSKDALARLADNLYWYVPADLDDLIDLASQTAEQRAFFEQEPTTLLPVSPGRAVFSFAKLGGHGTPEQQLAVFKWQMAAHIDEYFPGLKRQVSDYRLQILDEHARSLPGRIRDMSPYGNKDVSVDDLERRERDTSLLCELEIQVYRQARLLEHEIAWPVLRRRLQEWPHYLKEEFEAWFARGGVEPSEKRLSLSWERDSHPLTDPVERRKDALRMFLAATADVHRRVIATQKPHLCRLIEKYRDRLLEDERVRYEVLESEKWLPSWPAPDSQYARGTHYFLLWEAAGSPSEFPKDGGESGGDKFQFMLARERMSAAVKALSVSPGYDRVVGQLWATLPLDSVESVELLAAIRRAGRLPVQIGVEHLLARLPDDVRKLPQGWVATPADRGWWRQEHEHQWSELSRSGIGLHRFLALLWCAARDGREQVDVLAVPMHDDPELESALLEWWCVPRRPEEEFAKLPPEYVRDPTCMPLVYQARHQVDGWHERLQALLSSPGSDGFYDAVRLSQAYRVESALPMLMSAWRTPNQWTPSVQEILGMVGRRAGRDDTLESVSNLLPHYEDRVAPLLLATIIALLRHDNPEHRAWFAALPLASWFHRPRRMYEASGRLDWSHVCRFLTLHDLPRLLEQDGPPTSDDMFAWRDRPLTPYWTSLGHDAVMAALDTLRTTISQHQNSEHNDQEQAQTRKNGLLAWLEELQHAALVTAVNGTAPSDYLVDLAFSVLANERDELHSNVATQLLDDELHRRCKEGSGPALADMERLLEHPGHALRHLAFDYCARNRPEHTRADLVLHAMDAHLRCSHEYRDKDAALLLAASSPELSLPPQLIGASSDEPIGGWLGLERKRMLGMGERYLSSAHRGRLLDWLVSDRPALRYLACHWLGLIGTQEWSEDILPLVDDPHPAVASAALLAWLHLRPGSLQLALESVPRRHWEPEHYALFFRIWLGTTTEHRGDEKGTRRSETEPLDARLITRLVGELLTTFDQNLDPSLLARYVLVATDTPSPAEQMLEKASEHQSAEEMVNVITDLVAEQISTSGPLVAERAAFLERAHRRWVSETQPKRTVVQTPDETATTLDRCGGDTINSCNELADVQDSLVQADGAAVGLPTSPMREQFATFLKHLLSNVYPPEWLNE